MTLISNWRTGVSLVIRSHIVNQRGASVVEYSLLLALIFIVAIGAMGFLGEAARDNISRSGSSMP